MKVIDTFMFNNEFDMLECRLMEIADAVDHLVAVEADVDHQDHPKPYHLSENLDRFEQWKDKLVVVRATGLPKVAYAPDPWARELAQREHAAVGLAQIGVESEDVILHGDVDEIPTAVAARNVRPFKFRSFAQRGHFWSLRWRYPLPWFGTVAIRAGLVDSFANVRNLRNFDPQPLQSAGWHLSWLGGPDAARAKVGSFCHPEVDARIREGLKDDRFHRHGIHVDGVPMERCEVDSSFPRYVREGLAPSSWFL